MKPQPTSSFPSYRGALAVMAVMLLAAGCSSQKPAAQVKGNYAFWPPYPDQPRVQFLTSYSSSLDVAPQKSGLDQLIYGKEPEQALSLSKPYGVEMYKGKIYVCDLRNASVTVLDIRNHRTLLLGKSGSDNLQTPTDIAIAPDGTKYIADLGRGYIAVYDEQDRRVNTFGHPGLKPVGLAVHGNDLYVCDFQASKVDVFDRRSGQVTRTIGGPGGEPGKFVRPLGVTVDDQGFVYVMDVMKCKLQKFDPKGDFVSGFGTITATAGGLVRPKHIAVDHQGVIYVVDAAFQNVQLFDQNGQVLTFFGAAGNHPGAMYLLAGINVHDGDLDLFKDYVHPAFQPERLVLVTNQFGPNKVAVYAFGHLKPGHTVQEIASSKGLVPAGTDDKKTGTPLPVVTPATTLPSDEVKPASPAPPASGQSGQGVIANTDAQSVK